MVDVKIIPFHIDHLKALTPRLDCNEVMQGKINGIHVVGPAWSGFINDEIAAVGGIRPVFEASDRLVGEGWLATSTLVSQYKKTFHKHLKLHLGRVQREYGFDVIMAGVRVGFDDGAKWLEHLGFELVNPSSQCYGPEWGNFVRYQRII